MGAVWERALVTGASSGIGAELCRQLAAQGTHLVLVARRRDRLETLASQLRRDAGVEAEVVVADLTDRGQLEQVAGRIAGDPPVDLVVNNAGFGSTRPVTRASATRERALTDVHVVATLRLSHAALVAMTPRGRGGLLNVASVAGFLPLPSSASYAAAKRWIRWFTEALHEEQRGTGIHVTVLAPGFVNTPMLAGPDADPDPEQGTPLVVPTALVVREGLAAVAANRAVCVPGRLWGTTARLLDHLPARVVRGALALRSVVGR